MRNGSVHALAALVDAKANVNVGIAADTTAIGRAIELGNLALVKQLLRGGARVNDKGGRAGSRRFTRRSTTVGCRPRVPARTTTTA